MNGHASAHAKLHFSISGRLLLLDGLPRRVGARDWAFESERSPDGAKVFIGRRAEEIGISVSAAAGHCSRPAILYSDVLSDASIQLLYLRGNTMASWMEHSERTSGKLRLEAR